MDFSVISDTLNNFLIGAHPKFPLGRAASTGARARCPASAPPSSACAGHCPEQPQGLAMGDIDRRAGFPAGHPR